MPLLPHNNQGRRLPPGLPGLVALGLALGAATLGGAQEGGMPPPPAHSHASLIPTTRS
jgi:hypothetical protein